MLVLKPSFDLIILTIAVHLQVSLSDIKKPARRQRRIHYDRNRTVNLQIYSNNLRRHKIFLKYFLIVKYAPNRREFKLKKIQPTKLLFSREIFLSGIKHEKKNSNEKKYKYSNYTDNFKRISFAFFYVIFITISMDFLRNYLNLQRNTNFRSLDLKYKISFSYYFSNG